jgi:hypothetical protein
MKKILDQFTHLDLKRQRKYQLRKAAAGLCMMCGKPEVMKGLCEKHYKQALDYSRKRIGVTKFLKNTKFNRLMLMKKENKTA